MKRFFIFFREFPKQQSTLRLRQNRTLRQKKNFPMSTLFIESISDLMNAIM